MTRAGVLFCGSMLWLGVALFLVASEPGSRETPGRGSDPRPMAWVLPVSVLALGSLSVRFGFRSSVKERLGLGTRAFATFFVGVGLVAVCTALTVVATAGHPSGATFAAILGGGLVFASRAWPGPTSLDQRRGAIIGTGVACAAVSAGLVAYGRHGQHVQALRVAQLEAAHETLVGDLAHAGPPKPFSLGEAVELQHGESASLRDHDLTLTVESVDYSPMQWANGAEMWPLSLFHLAARCHGTTTRIDMAFRGPALICGFHLSLDDVRGKDEGFFIVQGDGAPEAGPGEAGPEAPSRSSQTGSGTGRHPSTCEPPWERDSQGNRRWKPLCPQPGDGPPR